jgi:hypothetical protein
MKPYFFLIACTLVIFSSCKEVKKEENSSPVIQKVDQSGPEFTSAYICPMNCKGSGSDKPGVCPVCGMDYEQNPAFVNDTLSNPK